MNNTISAKSIVRFESWLKAEERSAGTIEKYIRHIRGLSSWLGEKPITKEQQLVHLCDYIASRNFINIEYDNNENIIEGRRN